MLTEMEQALIREKFPKLSKREMEVLSYRLFHYTLDETALKLRIEGNTVRAHVFNMGRKYKTLRPDAMNILMNYYRSKQ